MKRTVSTADLIANAGEIIEAVHEEGGCYVVSKDGNPHVAIVPIEMLEEFESRRARLGKSIEALREACKDVDPDELRAVIDETVAEVRKERRERKLKLAQPENL